MPNTVDAPFKDTGNEKTNEDVQEFDPSYTEGYQNYDQTADSAQYEQGNENVPYETQEYDQTQDVQQYDQNPADYQNQNYEEGYTDGQYENYNQYPQQYTDPNAQYQGEYENYGTQDYEGNQNYDNTQHNQEYTPEYQETQNVESENIEPQTDISDSKRSNSPNEKVTKS